MSVFGLNVKRLDLLLSPSCLYLPGWKKALNLMTPRASDGV